MTPRMRVMSDNVGWRLVCVLLTEEELLLKSVLDDERHDGCWSNQIVDHTLS